MGHRRVLTPNTPVLRAGRKSRPSGLPGCVSIGITLKHVWGCSREPGGEQELIDEAGRDKNGGISTARLRNSSVVCIACEKNPQVNLMGSVLLISSLEVHCGRWLEYCIFFFHWIRIYKHLFSTLIWPFLLRIIIQAFRTARFFS